MYENTVMKPVQNCLGEQNKNVIGVNLIKVLYMQYVNITMKSFVQ
jgi:hypothetical protein